MLRSLLNLRICFYSIYTWYRIIDFIEISLIAKILNFSLMAYKYLISKRSVLLEEIDIKNQDYFDIASGSIENHFMYYMYHKLLL